MEKSVSFKFLEALGLRFSEREYRNVSVRQTLAKGLKRIKNSFLLKYGQNFFLFSSINARSIRPKIWRNIGCEIGKGVFIGAQVMPDSSNAELIVIEDGVHIAARSIILCHQRDLSQYFVGDEYGNLPYIRKKVHLKKGCLIGTQSLIMPGVTVGEGAIVGAYSLVTKDVPPWTIVAGRPARVIKKVPEKLK